MHSLIVFASGRGTNAQAIIDYFRHRTDVRVSLIVSNKADAGVLRNAEQEGIPALVIDRQGFAAPDFIAQLQTHQPSLLVLAGFLWKIPGALVAAFRDRIVNIHPALLPAYGGKGMYGHHVHHAVLAAGELRSGITVHLVDEVYDNGRILLQAHCPVLGDDTADTLANRIHRLEHFYYPRSIEFLLGEL